MRFQDNFGPERSKEVLLGQLPDGSYRVGVYCATCLRRHGVTTLLALLQAAHYFPPGAWSWIRVARSGRADRGLIQFARRTDDGSSSMMKPGGGAELLCQRCGAHPRVGFDRLRADADASRLAGGSAINV